MYYTMSKSSSNERQLKLHAAVVEYFSGIAGKLPDEEHALGDKIIDLAKRRKYNSAHKLTRKYHISYPKYSDSETFPIDEFRARIEKKTNRIEENESVGKSMAANNIEQFLRKGLASMLRIESKRVVPYSERHIALRVLDSLVKSQSLQFKRIERNAILVDKISKAMNRAMGKDIANYLMKSFEHPRYLAKAAGDASGPFRPRPEISDKQAELIRNLLINTSKYTEEHADLAVKHMREGGPIPDRLRELNNKHFENPYRKLTQDRHKQHVADAVSRGLSEEEAEAEWARGRPPATRDAAKKITDAVAQRRERAQKNRFLTENADGRFTADHAKIDALKTAGAAADDGSEFADMTPAQMREATGPLRPGEDDPRVSDLKAEMRRVPKLIRMGVKRRSAAEKELARRLYAASMFEAPGIPTGMTEDEAKKHAEKFMRKVADGEYAVHAGGRLDPRKRQDDISEFFMSALGNLTTMKTPSSPSGYRRPVVVPRSVGDTIRTAYAQRRQARDSRIRNRATNEGFSVRDQGSKEGGRYARNPAAEQWDREAGHGFDPEGRPIGVGGLPPGASGMGDGATKRARIARGASAKQTRLKGERPKKSAYATPLGYPEPREVTESPFNFGPPNDEGERPITSLNYPGTRTGHYARGIEGTEADRRNREILGRIKRIHNDDITTKEKTRKEQKDKVAEMLVSGDGPSSAISAGRRLAAMEKLKDGPKVKAGVTPHENHDDLVHHFIQSLGDFALIDPKSPEHEGRRASVAEAKTAAAKAIHNIQTGEYDEAQQHFRKFAMTGPGREHLTSLGILGHKDESVRSSAFKGQPIISDRWDKAVGAHLAAAGKGSSLPEPAAKAFSSGPFPFKIYTN